MGDTTDDVKDVKVTAQWNMAVVCQLCGNLVFGLKSKENKAVEQEPHLNGALFAQCGKCRRVFEVMNQIAKKPDTKETPPNEAHQE